MIYDLWFMIYDLWFMIDDDWCGVQVNHLDWTDVQGWAGMGGTRLGTTRFFSFHYFLYIAVYTL